MELFQNVSWCHARERWTFPRLRKLLSERPRYSFLNSPPRGVNGSSFSLKSEIHLFTEEDKLCEFQEDVFM